MHNADERRNSKQIVALRTIDSSLSYIDNWGLQGSDEAETKVCCNAFIGCAEAEMLVINISTDCNHLEQLIHLLS